jgi:hypothetical protein
MAAGGRGNQGLKWIQKNRRIQIQKMMIQKIQREGRHLKYLKIYEISNVTMLLGKGFEIQDSESSDQCHDEQSE